MARGTVESATELDVNWCNREGIFERPQRGVLTWTRDRDGEETASVGYVYRSDGSERLRLVYTVTKPTGESVDMDYAVPIERTECHFGGTRPWFLCPICDARVGKLYKGTRYSEHACRDCQDLIYKSQKHRSQLAQASLDLREAHERIQDGGLSWEVLRQSYDAQQAMVDATNDTTRRRQKRFEQTDGDWGAFEHDRMDDLPPFEKWVDQLFAEACAGGQGAPT